MEFKSWTRTFTTSNSRTSVQNFQLFVHTNKHGSYVSAPFIVSTLDLLKAIPEICDWARKLLILFRTYVTILFIMISFIGVIISTFVLCGELYIEIVYYPIKMLIGLNLVKVNKKTLRFASTRILLFEW